MLTRGAFLVAVACVTAACGEGTNPAATSRVVVTREENGLRLHNRTDQPTAYAAFDASVLPLINWAKCVTPVPACLRLPARGTAFIPFDQIGFFGPSTKEVVVYTWWVVPIGDGTYRADDDQPIGITF